MTRRGPKDLFTRPVAAAPALPEVAPTGNGITDDEIEQKWAELNADDGDIRIMAMLHELLQLRSSLAAAKGAMEEHISDGRHVGPRSAALHEAIRNIAKVLPTPPDNKGDGQ